MMKGGSMRNSYCIEDAINWLYRFFGRDGQSLVDETHLLEIALQKPSPKNKVLRNKEFCFSDIEKAISFIRANSVKKPQCGFYFGPALRFRKPSGDSRASKDIDVQESNLVVADIDWKDADFDLIKVDIEMLFKQFPYKNLPNLIAYTGNGVQCFWLFKELEKINVILRIQKSIYDYLSILLKEVNVSGCTLDRSVLNPSTLMRIPETINVKNGKMKQGVIIQENMDVLYCTSDFDFNLEQVSSVEIHETGPDYKNYSKKISPVWKEVCELYQIGILCGESAVYDHINDNIQYYVEKYKMQINPSEIRSMASSICKKDQYFKCSNGAYYWSYTRYNVNKKKLSDFRMKIIAEVYNEKSELSGYYVKIYKENAFENSDKSAISLIIPSDLRLKSSLFKRFMLEKANCEWNDTGKTALDLLFKHEIKKAQDSLKRIKTISQSGFLKKRGWITQKGILTDRLIVSWDDNGIAWMKAREGVILCNGLRDSSYIPQIEVSGNENFSFGNLFFKVPVELRFLVGYIIAGMHADRLGSGGMYIPALLLNASDSRLTDLFLTSVYKLLGLDFYKIRQDSLNIASVDDLRRILSQTSCLPVYIDYENIKSKDLKDYISGLLGNKNRELREVPIILKGKYRMSDLELFKKCIVLNINNESEDRFMDLLDICEEYYGSLLFLKSDHSILLQELNDVCNVLEIDNNDLRAMVFWGLDFLKRESSNRIRYRDLENILEHRLMSISDIVLVNDFISKLKIKSNILKFKKYLIVQGNKVFINIRKCLDIVNSNKLLPGELINHKDAVRIMTIYFNAKSTTRKSQMECFKKKTVRLYSFIPNNESISYWSWLFVEPGNCGNVVNESANE